LAEVALRVDNAPILRAMAYGAMCAIFKSDEESKAIIPREIPPITNHAFAQPIAPDLLDHVDWSFVEALR
jgi:hypothetical protein